MFVKRTSFILPALLLLLAAHAAVAAVPQTIAFQGFLSDQNGAPLDGTVSLQLSLYDVPTGGTALWTETQTSVVVSEGVFAVALGAVTPFPDGLFAEAPRHMGVRVNGEAELPRTQLRSSPFAFRAQSADTLSRAIQLRTPLGTPVLRSVDTGNGRLLVFDNLFNGEALRIGADFDSGGLLVMRDGNSETVRLDGNALGGSQLTLSGIGSSVVLLTVVSGDLAVQLPSSSIAAPEMRDEPGLASNRNTNFTALTSTPSSVLSRMSSICATLRTVFPNVYRMRIPGSSDNVVLAAERSLDFQLPSETYPGPMQAMAQQCASGFKEAVVAANTRPLTDDWAPVEHMVDWELLGQRARP